MKGTFLIMTFADDEVQMCFWDFKGPKIFEIDNNGKRQSSALSKRHVIANHNRDFAKAFFHNMGFSFLWGGILFSYISWKVSLSREVGGYPQALSEVVTLREC